MATKKQILFPVLVLGVGVGALFALTAMKKPPEEKPEVNNVPVVAIEQIERSPMRFTVDSYGVVTAKFDTDLVSQVSGEIVYISDAFVKGGFVKQGDILAKIDPSDYESALLDAQANVASAKAALVQEKAYGVVAEREWSRIEDSVPTDLSLRKPQLAQELAKLDSAEAGFKRAKRDLERTVIKAPFDALIESREIGLGSYASVGKLIGAIHSISTAEVRLPVADQDLSYLENKGIGAQVIINSEYAGKLQKWQAKIVRSEGVIDNKSRMTYLVAQINDPYGLQRDTAPLRFGAYVNASILGKDAGVVAQIPRHLVIDNKVPLLDSDNKLRFQPVEVLRERGAQVIVGMGLNDGDKLITSALDYPVDGMLLSEPQATKVTSEAVADASDAANGNPSVGNKE